MMIQHLREPEMLDADAVVIEHTIIFSGKGLTRNGF